MRRSIRALVAGMILLLLAACGGGDSDPPIVPGKKTVTGVITDGPIAGARISLASRRTGEVARICGAGGTGRCETISTTGGVFSFSVSPLADLDGLEFVSSGGVDEETGVDFAAIRLRAPAELFTGREDRVTISPVTSLLAMRMRHGETPAIAEAQLRRWLDLPIVDLAGRPSADADLKARTLLLAALALEVVRSGQEDPFSVLGDRLHPDFPLIAEGAVQLPILANLVGNEDDDGLAAKRLEELWREIVAAAAPAAVFKKVLIRQGLREISERLLAADPTSDATHPRYLDNLDRLAEKIVTAAGTTRIPLGNGVTAQRIARYLFFTYELTSFARLAAEEAVFATYLLHPESAIALEADPNIAELAKLQAVYSAAVPLLDDEIPGNDNRRRAEYFYSSDLSPFYFAEKVAEEILDDQFSDAVMLEIARGKAGAGLFAEAEALVATQIFQTEWQGKGYYEVAGARIDFGQFPEAVAALHQARTLFTEVIETKGYSSIEGTDVTNLQHVGLAYRRAGDLPASLEVFSYLSHVARSQSTAVAYASVVVGLSRVVEEYLQENARELALPVIDEMLDLALLTPAGTDGSYLFQIINLQKTALQYFAAEEDEKVYQVYLEAERIRQNHPATATKTWKQMETFVDLLYRTGKIAEAFSLAGRMPASNALKGYKMIATAEAVQNGLPAAMDIIEAYLPQPADKIEALTYLTNNKNTEYIALALIHRDILETARQAIDAAAAQMEFLTPASDFDRYQQLIQRGHVKLADLYALSGAPEQALALLQKGDAALAAIAGLKYRVDGLTEIAEGYQALGQGSAAKERLEQARAEIDAATSSGASIAPRDFAAMYDRLLDSYLDVGFREEALPVTAAYAAVARKIFDPATVYAGNDHDTLAGSEVDQLLEAASYRRLCGDFPGAAALVAEAEATARQIWVEATQNAKLIDIAGGYADGGEFAAALALARSLAASTDRHQALQRIAMTYASRDDFPDTLAAGIDTDRDGAPDFYHPFASAAEIADSGLMLDEDCDDDGIPDGEDRRPLMKDPPGFR